MSAHSNNTSLDTWLARIERAHPVNIDMGLARINEVYARLSLDFSQSCVVTVAGTNGKGSTCRFIEQACVSTGITVGVYSSPHIEVFNERIRINGVLADDHLICAAFEGIDAARGDISLTYFEYATLASMLIFAQQSLQVCIFEVGLGGRLDATNIIDANVGVITSIALDHQAYLGNSLNGIAREKAGIIKNKQQVVIGYERHHSSIDEQISQLAVEHVYVKGRDFGNDWIAPTSSSRLEFDVSKARIPKPNILTAIAALHCVENYFIERDSSFKDSRWLSHDNLQGLINEVSIEGRFETIKAQPLIILDVAHNEASAQLVCENLRTQKYKKLHIIVGMLSDKNIEVTLARLLELKPTCVHCIDLPPPRGEKAHRLARYVENSSNSATVAEYTSFDDAYQSIQNTISRNDCILIVGSFVLASQCKSYFKETFKG